MTERITAEQLTNTAEMAHFPETTREKIRVVDRRVQLEAVTADTQKTATDNTLDGMEKESYKSALAEHGIVDYGSLMAFRLLKFRRLSFTGFMSCRAFVERVVGYKVKKVQPNDLENLSKQLELPLLSEPRKEIFLTILKELNGVVDRATLIKMGVSVFNSKNPDRFGQFESGIKFYTAIFGRCPGRYLVLDDLHAIADVLEFPRLNNEERAKVALKKRGIVDKFTLIELGPKKFVETDFPPIGKGCKLAGMVLGQTFRKITSVVLQRLIKKIALPHLSSQTIQLFYNTLSSNGIYDKKTLKELRTEDFQSMDFEIKKRGLLPAKKMKGRAFLSAFFGFTVDDVTRQMLDDLGNMLRLPEDAGGQPPNIRYYDVRVGTNELNGYNKAEIERLSFEFLVENCHVYDLDDLMKKGCHWFEKKIFKNLGRGGVKIRGLHIASIILGEPIYQINEPTLARIGRALHFKSKETALSLNVD